MGKTLRFSSKFIQLLVISGLGLALSGCASLISGYNSEFQCPDTDKGKCVSVKTAYRESLEGRDVNPLVKEKNETQKQCKDCKQGEQGQEDAQKGKVDTDPEHVYRAALYRKLTSMIGKPSTPIVVPPEVVRVLILSYTGANNELFSYRYVYFFATEPKWIISTAKEVD